MATWAWAQEALSAGIPMTHDALGPLAYVRAHPEVDPSDPPATLGGAVDTCIVNESAGLQLESAGPVMLGGVLCHGAQLALQTRWFL